jgi:hypothetical protein
MRLFERCSRGRPSVLPTEKRADTATSNPPITAPLKFFIYYHSSTTTGRYSLLYSSHYFLLAASMHQG